VPNSTVRERSLLRLFALYASITLVPVLVLGITLNQTYRDEARQRGLAVARSEAVLVAQTAVEPILDGRPLSSGLTPTQVGDLQRLVARAVGGHDVLRLRLRDLAGHVVFSDDGSGFNQAPEDEALDAARGSVVERLTRLNADTNDTGAAGPASAEIYLPLDAGSPRQRVGVLEMYLPYGPIDADVSAGLHTLFRHLVLGLAALYVGLFVISLSVSRGLRRQVRLNKFLAEHDPLTDLPNRSLFRRRARETVALTSRIGRRTVLAIVDLDRFKEVNDTLGHHNGDDLLTQLAGRLAANARPQDTVARLGGDEFGIILTDLDSPEEVLHRLRDLIEHEVDLSGLPVSVESSIGYVVAPDDGSDVDQLIQRADVAMYVAKTEHRGIVRYSEALDHYDAANLSLIAQLRRAVEEEELVLHYQPKARLADGGVDAVEALVRWQHPTLGLLSPQRFIPLAEQTDLIERVTTWVLTRALSDLRDLGPSREHVAVAVNVSARSLGRDRFARQVMELLERVGVAPERLIIEITETALLTDPPRAAALLRELASAGVRVSLDDFGVGQTSLGYLSSLPVHELKIDRSFVADMLSDPAHLAIVRSVVDLGHNLDLRVVGEGVETVEVLDALRDSGCDVAQGYLISRPMDLDALRPWLAASDRMPMPT